MAGWNVKPDDVRQLSNKMKNWATQFETLQNQLRQTSENLKNQWNDPQYETFISEIRMLGKRMKDDTDNLRDRARILEDMARNLEREQNEYRQRMQQRR